MSHRRTLLRIAQIVPSTQAEGPGRRFAVWFQGCPLRCPGCCNPEMLPFSGGEVIPLEELTARIIESDQRHDLAGITLLGGEPFAHARGAAELAETVRERKLSVMIFTGYDRETLEASDDAEVRRLLAATDILVDGPYDRDQPDTTRRWIGSANQRVHYLTDRDREDRTCWNRSDTLEIRLVNGELTVNGFPAAGAETLWRRPSTGRAGD